MSVILHIESATYGCSVALSDEGLLLYEKGDYDNHNNAVSLGVLVGEALSLSESRGLDLQAVAVSSGPGSYTGLRIGVSMAKGLCYARNLKLIQVPTLKLLCVKSLLYGDLPENALLCPMLDARRMEVYSAIYSRALDTVRNIKADVVTPATYDEYLQRGPLYFLGSGAEKCKEIITHGNAVFLDGVKPEARYMVPLAELSFNRGEFQDVAYFEPCYLKDFVAIKPKSII